MALPPPGTARPPSGCGCGCQPDCEICKMVLVITGAPTQPPQCGEIGVAYSVDQGMFYAYSGGAWSPLPFNITLSRVGNELFYTVPGRPAVSLGQLPVASPGTFAINSSGQLVWTQPDGAATVLGPVVGDDGAPGQPGTFLINSAGHLIWNKPDGSQADLGPVVGANGTNGTNGTNGAFGTIAINQAGHLVWTKPDGSTVDLGNVVGPAGTNGANAAVGTFAINQAGHLIWTKPDATTVDLGDVTGTDGADAQFPACPVGVTRPVLTCDNTGEHWVEGDPCAAPTATTMLAGSKFLVCTADGLRRIDPATLPEATEVGADDLVLICTPTGVKKIDPALFGGGGGAVGYGTFAEAPKGGAGSYVFDTNTNPNWDAYAASMIVAIGGSGPVSGVGAIDMARIADYTYAQASFTTTAGRHRVKIEVTTSQIQYDGGGAYIQFVTFLFYSTDNGASWNLVRDARFNDARPFYGAIGDHTHYIDEVMDLPGGNIILRAAYTQGSTLGISSPDHETISSYNNAFSTPRMSIYKE